MRVQTLRLCACMFLAGLTVCVRSASAQDKKDYLSTTEAEKVREIIDPSERIRLFVSFASDRLKQLQYELDHPANTVRRSERLNGRSEERRVGKECRSR